MLGKPRTNFQRIAFRSVDILGLHNDWCANMMELAQVLMKFVNVAILMCSELLTVLGFLCGLPSFPGSVHKLVAGSLNPCKITCSLYIT